MKCAVTSRLKVVTCVVELLRSKDLKVRLAQRGVEWRRVFYPSIVEGDAGC